ncbi:MAG: molybdopterin-dependent oxidoreductase [Candidatus Eremiobacteraeota bacterium]|nr:molybdopterin-dependent oxidoreductase [Candidatus Eremiobacteraeota bacterium]
MKRSLFIATSLSAAVTGCAPIGTALNSGGFHNALSGAEKLNHLIIGTRGMAKEYSDADVDNPFRMNGFDTPSDSLYTGLMKGHFRGYKLVVDGAVERKQTFTLDRLRRMAQQTQITRHDCVEGWSAIGKWRGVRLADILDAVKPRSDAKYAVFHCMDISTDNAPYYESLDIHEATHPQTLLALDLNDRPLDPDHGAPVRLRVPTQLGYKSAKWVKRIEFVGSYRNIYSGNGGYWEDQGYEWYAGI